jgi:formiminoglutamase
MSATQRRALFWLVPLSLVLGGSYLLDPAIYGIAGIFGKLPGEIKEIGPKLGEALIIAAVLTAIVDPYLKRELAEQVARDALNAAAGHDLPQAVKNEIQRIIRAEYTRRRFTIVFNISGVKDHDGFVTLVMHTAYDIENETAFWVPCTIRTSIELPRGPELVPPEIARSALLALSISGPSSRIDLNEDQLRARQATDDTYIFVEEKVALPPKGRPQIHVETTRSIVYPETWFYVLDLLGLTIDVDVVLGDENNFRWNVHFGAHGKPEHSAGRWSQPGAHLPGHFARITWTKIAPAPVVTKRLDAHWPTAAAWLAGQQGLTPIGSLAVLGVPISSGSITPGRCDLAPDAIRSTLARYSPFEFSGTHDLSDLRIVDLGNMDVARATIADAADPISSAVRNALQTAEVLVILGGDNSLTWPACRALGIPLTKCGLLTLDAHFDLRDLDQGPTNGTPVRALLGDGLPGSHIVQVGIQSFANSAAYAEIARSEGIRVITADEVRARGIVDVISDALDYLGGVSERIYVDFDVDVLDRMFAPATPGSRPGGLQPADLFTAARYCGANPKVVAIDIVEIDPTRDVADATVLAAARCFLSFAAGYRERIGHRQSAPAASSG